MSERRYAATTERRRRRGVAGMGPGAPSPRRADDRGRRLHPCPRGGALVPPLAQVCQVGLCLHLPGPRVRLVQLPLLRDQDTVALKTCTQGPFM
ncbi:hypothetical protein CRUP_017009 [Coryphaenoides rupestris]|nr:hypothetical protein CRUP_017009 [Coryphaenoides rupestris]